METTLHRQLKDHYAGPGSQQEVRLGRFRIDVVDGERLIEIQHSGLGALKTKVRKLLRKHDVEIVKPLVARKRLIQLDGPEGETDRVRWSPKRATAIDVFHELVYFTTVFPHRRLTLRIPLIEIEEIRYPWQRRNRRRGQFRIRDQRLIQVVGENVYRTAGDLQHFVPRDLPEPFDTGQLAAALEIEKWEARRMAWCLRETGTIRQTGKRGNSLLYCRRAA